MLLGRPVHRGQGHGLVEGDEAPAMRYSYRKQVSIGHLAWPVQAGAVHDLRVEHADITRPERVVSAAAGSAQQVDSLRRRNRARVAGLTDDPHEAVFRDRSRRPPRCDFAVEPVTGTTMIDVIAVEQRQKDIDVEQRPLHSASSSLSRSISALEMAAPRRGRGLKPCRSVPASASWRSCPVSAWRARSESTAPVVRFSRRARSCTASSTSSSMLSVVRMHVMLVHVTWRQPLHLLFVALAFASLRLELQRCVFNCNDELSSRRQIRSTTSAMESSTRVGR